MSKMSPFPFHPGLQIFSFLAILWMTFFVAFVASMAFESPFLGLEKIIMAGMGKIRVLVAGKRASKASKQEYSVRYTGMAKERKEYEKI